MEACPRGTRSSGHGTGSGEGPSAHGVQRTARSLCTDHNGHVEFRPIARSETEPQRGWRHLPQQFGGSRLDFGDFAFGMEGCAAVLSRDGKGGALLREVAKLVKFEDSTVAILERSFWDVQQLSAAMAAALITCTRGEVATLVRRILSVSPGDGLQAWHAVTQWFKPRSVVEQAASMARLISPKRTKNVNELQVAVMQWELTLDEHESKFSEVVPTA